MASLIENMITILEEEELLHEKLVELAKGKADIIIKNDIEGLQRITASEQTIMDAVLAAEKRREECLKDISIVINKPVDTITVTVLAELMKGKPDIQRRLTKIHDNFGGVLKKLKALNERNSALIKESLDMIQFDLNLLTAMRQTPITADYDKNAGNVGMHTTGRGVFDKIQ